MIGKALENLFFKNFLSQYRNWGKDFSIFLSLLKPWENHFCIFWNFECCYLQACRVDYHAVPENMKSVKVADMWVRNLSSSQNQNFTRLTCQLQLQWWQGRTCMLPHMEMSWPTWNVLTWKCLDMEISWHGNVFTNLKQKIPFSPLNNQPYIFEKQWVAILLWIEIKARSDAFQRQKLLPCFFLSEFFLQGNVIKVDHLYDGINLSTFIREHP